MNPFVTKRRVMHRAHARVGITNVAMWSPRAFMGV